MRNASGEELASSNTPDPGPDEVELAWILAARRGDDSAFARLVDAYQRPVYNVCYRMLGDLREAEDAAQETFLRAYTKLSTYDPGRKFSSWLLSIASHYCIDRLRRRRLKWISWDELPSWRWFPSQAPQPEEVAVRQEEHRLLHCLLESLPPDYRAAVVLRYWHELSYEEIALAMDTTVSAIKSRLFRARKMMASAADGLEQKSVPNGVVALLNG
jgi:RNA polymerase sigma-70 factor, ECF subfamily